MRPMRSRVSFAALAPDYGRTVAIGQVVDLDEGLPAGGTLADLVRPEWFEDAPSTAPDAPEARPRRRAATVPVPPAEPDTEN